MIAWAEPRRATTTSDDFDRPDSTTTADYDNTGPTEVYYIYPDDVFVEASGFHGECKEPDEINENDIYSQIIQREGQFKKYRLPKQPDVKHRPCHLRRMRCNRKGIGLRMRKK